MELICDDDVEAVCRFMQHSMSAAKLVSVARAVAALAPILWGRFEAESISALRFASLPPSGARAEHTQQDARAQVSVADADGGFEAATS